MERSTVLYLITAILFALCVIANLLSMIKQTNMVEEVLERSKRSPEDEFIAEALAEHNKLRKLHGSPPLTVDKELCAKAEEWAKKLAVDSNSTEKAVLAHSKSDLEFGENIGLCKCNPWTGEKISNSWYDEIKKFNWSNNAYDYRTGHFTQLIWKESKTFCIARYTAGPYSAAVAHYHPRGNEHYKEEFSENVLPPK